ncbi:putative reverse transcriptase domain-containing protein [Tanacetum coccineum]|uniref:Reverse transcriptase domain-containing protein n=1 Tax=Tanacetum coccineum TaxID=301880 RepID=A0ABQ4XS07_9ASTR
MTMISKDGEISKFLRYHSSKEEEPTKQPKILNKYGFVDHPKLQRNKFAPRQLPQREGNMNGWLIKGEDELLGYEASDEEVDSDLKSTARKMVPNLRGDPSNNNEENPDIATVIAQQLQNIIPQIATQVTANVNNANGGGGNGGNNGCSYKTFTACNPKEFDGKGGVVPLTRWIEKMESVFDNSGCTANQRVRYAASCFALLVEEFCPGNEMEKLENEFLNHTMVGANHVAYTDRFHELEKLVPHLVTPESSRIKRYINGLAPQIHDMLRATQPTTIQSAILTDGILTDEAVRCVTLTKGNDMRKEIEESRKQGSTWKDNKKSRTGQRFEATLPPKNDNRPGHFARNYDVPIKQVEPINAVRGNLEPGTCYKCGSREHYRNNCPKFTRAPVSALQDPNIVTGTFSLNHQYATVLFNSGADSSFISTDFALLLNVKPSFVNPRYVIEIADCKSVEVDRNKAVIVCYEKVVEILIKEGEILRVYRERTLAAANSLMSVKIDEPRISDIPVVQDFTDVFSEDLMGIPPQ